jgi:YgiT-type zinc finger domain-containing protein
MKCFICNQAETITGTTSVLLESSQMTLTIRDVPARICPQCGEAYVGEAVTEALLHHAGRMARAGTKVHESEFRQIEDWTNLPE